LKKLSRAIKLSLASWAGWLFVFFISKTLRIKTVNEQVWDNHQRGEKLIFAFWHGHLFSLIDYHQQRRVAIITSLSEDGEILSRILKRFNYELVRGSSSRGGKEALRGMMRKMEEGYIAAIAADGPKGPIHQAKPGVIFLAQRTRGWVIPATVKLKRFIAINGSWDKMEIPLPFSPVLIIYGEPFLVEKNRGSEHIEQRRVLLEEKLKELSEQAQQYFNR
jgi:lysophospholipid acyltransferase (LPLAT)-like uncharacterized protein